MKKITLLILMAALFNATLCTRSHNMLEEESIKKNFMINPKKILIPFGAAVSFLSMGVGYIIYKGKLVSPTNDNPSDAIVEVRESPHLVTNPNALPPQSYKEIITRTPADEQLANLCKQASIPRNAFDNKESAIVYEKALKNTQIPAVKKALIEIRQLLCDAGHSSFVQTGNPSSPAIKWIDYVLTQLRFGHCTDSLYNRGAETVADLNNTNPAELTQALKLIHSAKKLPEEKHSRTILPRVIAAGADVNGMAYRQLIDQYRTTFGNRALANTDIAMFPDTYLYSMTGISQKTDRPTLIQLHAAHKNFCQSLRPALGMNEAGVELSHSNMQELARTLNERTDHWWPFFKNIDTMSRETVLECLQELENLLPDKTDMDDSFHITVIRNVILESAE